MNSTRDNKAAVKAQKKQQKLVKKQQLHKAKCETDQMSKNQKNALQNNKVVKNATTAINNNNNNNNNNNVNEAINNNNSNVSKKFKEYYEQQQLQKQLINGNSSPLLTVVGPPKFERSGSFSLKGKLSKLINSITSSKESLNKTEDEIDLPFKFSRSRSMILPRRTNRRSLIEPQLEQLCEEDPTSPASPRKNSMEISDDNITPPRPKSVTNSDTSTPLTEVTAVQLRNTSTPILIQNGGTFDPVANFKKRRSSTLISSFKTTFGLGSEKKKDKLNDKWRASLQSLQAVDNMVSYENMSFIDYDKFNTYEKQLERKLSQISLMDPSTNCSIVADNIVITDNSSYVLPSPCTPNNVTPSPFVTPQTVVRRRKASTSLNGSARELAKRRSASRNSFSMDTDYEHNLDKPRNVYRESLDSRKLVLLNNISRNSYILDSDLVDSLDLALTPLTTRRRPYYKRCCSQLNAKRIRAGQDVIDGVVNVQLKSKSLTHLDGLESEIVCNPAKNPNNNKASITSTLTSAYPLTPSSLSPPSPQYKHLAKRSPSPVRSLQSKILSYPCRRLSTRLTPTIYTQAPQQQPTNRSLPNNLNSPTSLTPSCTTTTTAACCKSRICSSHVASATCSSSSLQLQTSHHHYHNNKFQSEALCGDTASAVVSSTNTTSTTATASGSSYHTLKPLPLPSVNDNIAASSSTLSFSMGEIGSISSTATISSASSLHPPGGCITPTTFKKKSSFLQRKKPLLTRSEVSSSEYFSVSFCTESSCQDEEFFPASKGVTLANALSQSLRRRNLSFNLLTITDSYDNNQTPAFLEAGNSPHQSSLDENTEVENLAGHHLIIMDKDSSRKTLQKAASFGSRNRPPRLLSSASTDETSETNLTGKQLKQRWSGLFGMKNPQQSQLCELLNNYSKNGVPQKNPATLSFNHPDFANAIDYLDSRHKSWMDVVESGNMNDSDMRIQTAIWELVTTEVDYIHCLQTVTDLFLACLEGAQEEGLLKEVDQHRLFANIRDICEANLKFWSFYLYPMVAHSIKTREPLRVSFFQQGFISFGNIFAPYKKYCAEQSTCQFYCKELNRTNSLFTSYLAWCEGQKMCNRLRLADILVRPMQRLTKYSLLLAAIKKYMTDVEEIEAIETMLHTTENFVFSVNNHLTTRQENERLKGVMARIETYDVVDTNNEHLEKMVKQYSQMFDLCGPMKGCTSQHVRHLFMEGDHKYKDNLGKVEVHCFLLTDMLLVCKSIAKKGLGTLKVIRQPYLTDRLIVQHSNNLLNCVYLNEFQVAISAFTLQCTEAKNWHEALKRAKMIYTRLKQSSLMNPWDAMRYAGSTADSLGVKKSSMNSSICSHVTSANNSHSGSVEWNDSRNISVDFEKTNSLSSDEGSSFLGVHGFPIKSKPVTTPKISQQKLKVNTTTASSSNMLTVQPLNNLGQSLPNLNLHHSHTNLYHTYSNNTLLVPGTANSAHSGNLLLSPSHRGISYPPPSPTRVPLRRGMAFSSSIKNPPLLKTRNITSQSSINWHQIPVTPTSPHSQHTSPSNNVAMLKSSTSVVGSNPTVDTILEQQEQQPLQSNTVLSTDCTSIQLTNSPLFSTQLSNSTETDV